MLRFLCDFDGQRHTLADSERQYSVFGGVFWRFFAKMNGNAPFSKPFFTSKVGGLNRLDWVGMLRFRQIWLGTLFWKKWSQQNRHLGNMKKKQE